MQLPCVLECTWRTANGERRDDVVLTRRGVAGHLSGLAGRPLAGHVWISDLDGKPVAETRSDEGGWFWFDVGPDFRGMLQASAEEHGALLGTVAEVVAGQDVYLQLRPQ